MHELDHQILEILQELRPDVDFAREQGFAVNGVLDSTDVVSLVATLDGAFRISIKGTDIVPEHFDSVDAIAKLLRSYGVAS